MMRQMRLALTTGGWLFLLSSPLGAVAQAAEALWRQANKIYTQQPEQALRLFRQAETMARQQRRPDLAANIYVDEATLHYAVYNDYVRAGNTCRLGLALRPLADSTRFKLWASLGEMYHRQNRADSTHLCWREADALLLANRQLERDTPAYVAAFYGNRGTLAFEHGDYRLAEQSFRKQSRLLNQHGSRLQNAVAENQFAYYYLKVNQLARADSLFGMAVRHCPASLRGDDLNLGWFLLGLIDCRLQRQRPDSLLPLLVQTEQIARLAGVHGRELHSYLALAKGRYFTLQQQPTLARRWFNQSLVLAWPLGNAWLLVWQNQMALSKWHNRWGSQRQALAHVQEACQTVSVGFLDIDLAANPVISQFLSGPKLAESLYWKAHLLHAATNLPNHLTLANKTYEQALALSEHLQASYGSEVTRLFVQTQLRPALEEAVAVAYQCYRQQPGPATLHTLLLRQEQASAAVLLRSVDLENQLPAAVQTQWQRARQRLSTAKIAFASEPRGYESASVKTELVDAELAWGRLQQQTAGVARLVKSVRKDNLAPLPVVAQLQGQLDSLTAFLHYSLTPDSVLLTVIQKQTVAVHCLPIGRDQLLQGCLRLRREVYRNPDPFHYAGQAEAQILFNALVGPVWGRLKAMRRLVIVRDGPMHHLPFEVLAVSAQPDDYLLRHAAITYAYSAASFVGARRPLSTTTPLLLSMAPFVATDATLARIRQRGYVPLPASEQEAGAVAGTHTTGENASKALFLALVPTHQLLHLATHAEANQTDFDESYVAFYPTDTTHRLYAHEIINLSLRHMRLTTLTACRTGSGPLQAGEGLLGLARAFAAAGCPQTVASLWNAHDGSTATLTRLFYDELEQGLPTDVALQRAKLRFLAGQPNGGAYTPPHFWAHLILIGQNQPVYPSANQVPVGWLLLTATVLGLGIWRWRTVRR